MKMDEITAALRSVLLYYEDTEQRRAQWEQTKQKNLNQADLIRSMANRNDGLRARNETLERGMREVRSLADQLYLLQYLILDGMTDLPTRLLTLFGKYQSPLLAFLLYDEDFKIKGIGSYYGRITLTAQKKFTSKLKADYLDRLKKALQLIPSKLAAQGELIDGKRQSQ